MVVPNLPSDHATYNHTAYINVEIWLVAIVVNLFIVILWYEVNVTRKFILFIIIGLCVSLVNS